MPMPSNLQCSAVMVLFVVVPVSARFARLRFLLLIGHLISVSVTYKLKGFQL